MLNVIGKYNDGGIAFRNRNEFGNFQAHLQFLSECLVRDSDTKEKKILEIGSGKGCLLNHLLRAGYDICGVEINEALINESKHLFGNLPLQKVAGAGLPFEDSSFDVVLSFDVFEHIPDSDIHLQEVKRVLKPNGRYLLQTPNKWTNAVFETVRWRSFAWMEDHCSLHNYWEIQQRFRKHGFQVRFRDIPVVTDFFKLKLESYLGKFGLFLLRILNPDRIPIPFRTNFYVESTKLDR